MARRKRKPDTGPETTGVPTGDGSMVQVPAGALRAITTALLPELMRHGGVSLTIGTPSPPRSPAQRGTGAYSNGHVVSARFDEALIAQVRECAAIDGVSVSGWLRNAAWVEIQRRRTTALPPGASAQRVTGWQCEHVNMSGPPSVLLSADCGRGCTMRPVYQAA